MLDTRASFHMTPHRSWFTSYRECDGGKVFMGNGFACNVVAVGMVRIRMFDGVKRTLIDVRHVPDLKQNLISLGVLEAKGCKYTGIDSALKVSKGAQVIMKAQRLGNLYKLIGSTSKSEAAVDVADCTSACVWHVGHGHRSGQGRKAETRG
ncbi:hypothetical protein PJI17_30885, partial [Mycobacterium kansasii]